MTNKSMQHIKQLQRIVQYILFNAENTSVFIADLTDFNISLTAKDVQRVKDGLYANSNILLVENTGVDELTVISSH